jgi:hypothetical protein
MLAVLDAGHDLTLAARIAFQLVGDPRRRRWPLLLQQLADQAFGSLPVTPALDREIENKALLIDRASEPMRLPALVMTTSSKCHLLPRGRVARRRTRLVNSRPNLGSPLPGSSRMSKICPAPTLRSNVGSVG